MLKENLLKFRLRTTLAALGIKNNTFARGILFSLKHVTSLTIPNFIREICGLGF